MAKVIRPTTHFWFAVSIALHSVLLFVPIWPRSPEAESPSQTKSPPIESVPITQLLPSSEPSPLPPSPLIPQSPVQTSTPIRPPSVPVRPRSPAVASSAPSSPLPTPLPPSRSVPSPAPTVVPSPSSTLNPPPSSTPSSLQSSTPTPSPVSPSVPSTTPSVTPPSDPAIPTLLTNFPHVVDAQTGCSGSDRCWQTSDTQWRAIAHTMQQNLKERGYVLESVPLNEDTGRTIYRVSKAAEEPYYLHFISTLQGTVYSITQQPMTVGEMNELSGFSR